MALLLKASAYGEDGKKNRTPGVHGSGECETEKGIQVKDSGAFSSARPVLGSAELRPEQFGTSTRGGAWGRELLGSQACFSIGEMKYYLHESAPPTCLKGGMAVDASALSPLSAGKAGSGRQPQGGDAEQTTRGTGSSCA